MPPDRDVVKLTFRIYALVRDCTIDKPLYRPPIVRRRVFPTCAFVDLDRFRDAVIQRLPIGFLSTQFFRVCTPQGLQRDSFLTCKAELQAALIKIQAKETPAVLCLVRYSKQQALQLVPRVSDEEDRILCGILRFRRKYGVVPYMAPGQYGAAAPCRPTVCMRVGKHLPGELTRKVARLLADKSGVAIVQPDTGVVPATTDTWIPLDIPAHLLGPIQRALGLLLLKKSH